MDWLFYFVQDDEKERNTTKENYLKNRVPLASTIERRFILSNRMTIGE
jgi:hypothetical protein